MRDLQGNQTEPEQSPSKFPVAKSVRGKIAVIAGTLLVPSLLSIGLSSGRDDRAERDAEVISLMSDYSVDDVSILTGHGTGTTGVSPVAIRCTSPRTAQRMYAAKSPLNPYALMSQSHAMGARSSTPGWFQRQGAADETAAKERSF